MRLFTALWPDDSLRTALVQAQSSWRWPAKAALVRPQHLHVTLHFLGNVPPERLAALRQALRITFDPFTMHLGRSEVWGSGVAVLLPHDIPAALRALHRRTAGAIAEAGLGVEARPYRPHVTLARRAWHAQPSEGAFSLEWQAISGFVLVQTHPDGRGYEIIDRFGDQPGR